MSAQITCFVPPCLDLAKECVVGCPSPAIRRDEDGFADWVMLTILCFREREEKTFRSVIDKLKVMESIRMILGVERSELPDPCTVCKAMNRVTMALDRRLLSESVTLFALGNVAASQPWFFRLFDRA